VYLIIAKPLPGSIILEYHEEDWTQTIDYEHIPFRCRKCHEHGHLFRECPSMLLTKKGTQKVEKTRTTLLNQQEIEDKEDKSS
jgi:hypothetical protein